MAPIRELALHLLLQKENNVPFPVLLEQAYAKIPESGHNTQEKAFLMALCYGVLRSCGLLRQIFLPVCKKKPNPAMETCLCLALYELFFLGKSEYAIVNEYVELAKRQVGQAKAHALNAILHTILKDKERVKKELAEFQEQIKTPIPGNQIPGKKFLRRLHQLADLPELFTDNLHRTFYQRIVEESFSAPLPAFRINGQKKMDLPHELEPISPGIVFLPELNTTAEHAKQTEQTRQIEQTKQTEQAKSADELKRLAKQGGLSRQGIASALFAEKIAQFISENNLAAAPLWDMCCGRGGKSLALLEKNIHVSIVSEPSQARLDEFAKELQRLHLPAPQIIQGPAEECIQKSLVRKFPLILLDSPCTTSGTIARNPEVKYRITRESLAEILQTQEKLLKLAHAHLQEKGYLFYCTCSVFDSENKGQLKQFLADFPAMQLMHEEYIIPSALNPQLKGHDILYYAILQHTAI